MLERENGEKDKKKDQDGPGMEIISQKPLDLSVQLASEYREPAFSRETRQTQLLPDS